LVFEKVGYSALGLFLEIEGLKLRGLTPKNPHTYATDLREHNAGTAEISSGRNR
jgi:hypothetical protein